ncbi:CYTH and CHAD domain-containing protein [Agilicoccus flavus]|uniref:CYTH and CHAD domain-containing protein n=1 Tax=Agilicoccus flavus TaxID=2775968 RepID=UPI001CF6D268|nr:CYTH and CHAD domain-containing protein [Agilicoccus flavus]
MSESVETERTFEVPRRWSMPRLAGVGRVTEVSPARRMTQTATYLDTLGLDLLEAKHTLRRRTGGTDAGWHLKKPRGGDSRLEVAAPLGRGAVRIPAELVEQVADLAATRPLVPVCRLRTRRVRRRLLDESGATIALVEDDTVEATVLVDGERVHRWREVEVELVDGGDDDLEAVTRALLDSGLSVSDAPSKLARALSEVRGRRVPSKKGDPAGEVVLVYVGKQVAVLQQLDRAVRADAADAVHKSRVATRRLRSALKAFAPLFDTSVTEPLRAEIAWLTGALGGPRDAEVMRERLVGLLESTDPALVRGPAASRLRGFLDTRHQRAHADLVKALDSPRYERLMAALTELVVDPPLTDAGREAAKTALPPLIHQASTKVEKAARVARSSEDAAAREEAIHDVRKRAKAARYTAEAGGGAVKGDPGAVAKAWTGLQEALGEHQDSVVARGVLEEVCAQARKAGEDTFTYGVLIGREAQRAADIEGEYETLLSDARDAARSLTS